MRDGGKKREREEGLRRVCVFGGYRCVCRCVCVYVRACILTLSDASLPFSFPHSHIFIHHLHTLIFINLINA